MGAVTWTTPDAISTILSTGLASLADGGNALSTGTVDNLTNLDRYMALEFYLAEQSSARASDAHVAVYLLPTVDGTNYSYGSNSVDPSPANWLCSLAFDASTAARYVGVSELPIPPFEFKLLVMNETGNAFAASGNTLKYRTYEETVA